MADDLETYSTIKSHNSTLERPLSNLYKAGLSSDVRKSAMWRQQCSSCTGHLGDNLLAA